MSGPLLFPASPMHSEGARSRALDPTLGRSSGHPALPAPHSPARRRLRRGLAVGVLVATGLGLSPAAMAQEGAQAITGPIPASAGQQAPQDAVQAAAQASTVAPAAVPVTVPVSASAITPAVTPAVAEPRATVAAKQAAFLHFTTASPQATDRRGVEPSLYRGRFYRPGLERIRRCIVQRESSGVYTVRGGGGDRYYGAYQMNDDLADGATWMMLPEAKEMLGDEAARALMARLRAKPVTTWSRYWQDAAFFTIYNWERTGSGRAHWAGGRWRC